MVNYNPKDWFTFIFRFHKADTFRELFPLLIGLLSQKVPLSMGIGAFAAVSYGVVILAALSLPETRGKQLEAQ